MRGGGGSYLNLFLVERNAPDDIETRRLLGLGIRRVGGLEDRFIAGTARGGDITVSMYAIGLIPGSIGVAYAVLFLLPLGWRSGSACELEDSAP